MPDTSKGDFKTANFQLGTEGPDYITTNNQNLLGAQAPISKNSS